MRRRVERKVSHSADFRRAAVSSAAYPHFPNRETWLPYGYRAELGSAFLCASQALSSEPRPDHAKYVQSWLQALKNDKRAIFTAAAKAQQAADWLTAKATEIQEKAA
jgi:antirestriction protein ArdC